jgi:RNA-directed DNA polymerase
MKDTFGGECGQLGLIVAGGRLRAERLEAAEAGEARSRLAMSENGRSGATNACKPARACRGEAWGLLDEILERASLSAACLKVFRSKGAAGIDGMTASELKPCLAEHGDEWVQNVRDGACKPSPVRRAEIPKPDGGVRLLGIPTVLDRLSQQAAAQAPGGIFEPIFSESSCGFRPGRSARQAMLQAQECINAGHGWTVDIDLEKHFDAASHDKLTRLISNKAEDGRAVSLVRKFPASGVMISGVVADTEIGTPQGGPISPLLSNIMLNELDIELEKRGLRFCGYADGRGICVRSEKAAKRVMRNIARFLEGRLMLKVSQKKSKVDRPWNVKLLGFSFYMGKGERRIRVHEKSIKRIKAKLKEIAKRNRGVKLDVILKELKRAVTGWMNYFKIADFKSKANELDGWIRRHIRAFIWKQRKRVKTRFKNLKTLGASKETAWMRANTRKGCWRAAGSPALMTTITNKRLEKRGFIGFSAVYQKR